MEYNASDLLSDSQTNESWFFLVNQTYTYSNDSYEPVLLMNHSQRLSYIFFPFEVYLLHLICIYYIYLITSYWTEVWACC